MTFTLSLRIACSRILNRLGFATLLVDPAGDDNSVLYTAKEAGAGGEAISIAYATPAVQATTTVAVVGNAITVTPGTKARMVVTGTLTSDGSTPVVFPLLSYLEIYNTRAKYADTSGNYACVWTGFGWALYDDVSGVGWDSSESVVTPDLVTSWSPSGAATGTPIITAGVSSAAQVIAAVNASTPAAALVTASESGASTGPVAAVAADFLTLIPANALTLDGIVLTLDGETLTLD